MFCQFLPCRKLYFILFIYFFVFSRAAPEGYGGSQARDLIGHGLCQSHSNTGSEFATYTIAHGNAGSLTH